jgi:hypothetical protein
MNLRPKAGKQASAPISVGIATIAFELFCLPRCSLC